MEVLCLGDPWSHRLQAHALVNPVVPVARPPHPYPIGIDLTDGAHCRARVGGSWGRPQSHPTWVGFYSCGRTERVWGPRSLTGGIDTATPLWTVSVGTGTGALRVVGVRTAYYVGTAGGTPDSTCPSATVLAATLTSDQSRDVRDEECAGGWAVADYRDGTTWSRGIWHRTPSWTLVSRRDACAWDPAHGWTGLATEIPVVLRDWACVT